MQAPIFFFATCGTADAQRDDEVSGDLTICIDCQVSAAVVGRQPCLAGRIAELRETRQKRSVRCRRHADFKEVCKYQRLAGVCHIDCGRDCKHGFDAAAVGKQQIQLDDDITGDADVLRPEDRGTHTFIITFAGLCVQQFFRKVSVCANNGQFVAGRVFEEGRPGNRGVHIQFEVRRIIYILRVKAPSASDIYDSFDTMSTWERRHKALILNRFHALQMHKNGIVHFLHIDRFGNDTAHITVKLTEDIGIAAILIEVLGYSSTKAAHKYTSL